jgi:hypothetical protein
MNERLLEQVQLGGAAFLSGTRIDDVFWLRACVVNHRTREEHIDRVAAVVAGLTLESRGGANAR